MTRWMGRALAPPLERRRSYVEAVTTAPVPEGIPDDLRETLEKIRRLVDSILGPPEAATR